MDRLDVLMVEVQGIMVINNWFVLADGFMKAGWSVRDGTEENTSTESSHSEARNSRLISQVVMFLLRVISV